MRELVSVSYIFAGCFAVGGGGQRNKNKIRGENKI
uniref:Lipoprotein n=1 Tax=Dulem virus 39 TaxID=3145757 RepID=A0AAU8B6K6_9CAUD